MIKNATLQETKTMSGGGQRRIWHDIERNPKDSSILLEVGEFK